jgi:hypothetical protein
VLVDIMIKIRFLTAIHRFVFALDSCNVSRLTVAAPFWTARFCRSRITPHLDFGEAAFVCTYVYSLVLLRFFAL